MATLGCFQKWVVPVDLNSTNIQLYSKNKHVNRLELNLVWFLYLITSFVCETFYVTHLFNSN